MITKLGIPFLLLPLCLLTNGRTVHKERAPTVYAYPLTLSKRHLLVAVATRSTSFLYRFERSFDGCHFALQETPTAVIGLIVLKNKKDSDEGLSIFLSGGCAYM